MHVTEGLSYQEGEYLAPWAPRQVAELPRYSKLPTASSGYPDGDPRLLLSHQGMLLCAGPADQLMSSMNAVLTVRYVLYSILTCLSS